MKFNKKTTPDVSAVSRRFYSRYVETCGTSVNLGNLQHIVNKKSLYGKGVKKSFGAEYMTHFRVKS